MTIKGEGHRFQRNAGERDWRRKGTLPKGGKRREKLGAKKKTMNSE